MNGITTHHSANLHLNRLARFDYYYPTCLVQAIHTVVIHAALPVLQIHNLSLDVDHEKKKNAPLIVPARPSLYARNWHTGNWYSLSTQYLLLTPCHSAASSSPAESPPFFRSTISHFVSRPASNRSISTMRVYTSYEMRRSAPRPWKNENRPPSPGEPAGARSAITYSEKNCRSDVYGSAKVSK